MYKRGIDQLTGGTGDVNPQWLVLQISPANTTSGAVTEKQYQLPVQRLQTRGLAQVMEILKIEAMDSENEIDGNSIQTVRLVLASRSQGSSTTSVSAGNLSSVGAPGVITSFLKDINWVTGGAGTWIVPHYDSKDLTDTAGHGFLVGSDSLYLQLWRYGPVTSPSTSEVYTVRILYRQKNVSMAEYVGMVQQ